MSTGAKMSVGIIAAGRVNTKTLSLLTHFRLPVSRLRNHHHVGRLSSFSLPRAVNFKLSPPPPCRLRAVLGDGGLGLHNAGATALVVTGAYALVSTFDNLTRRNLIQQDLSRKLVHILSGLLFMASWPIFSTSTGARYFASLVPLINCIRLVVYGLSLANDEGLIKSVTRKGKPEELLRGPLYYVLILILSAIFFWRDSPVGVISVSMMCGGDGIADIMGRRFGSLKLPYNQQKSWAGSISMFVFGLLISLGMLYYFSALGYFHLEWSWTMQRVALVSFVATLVESLPANGIVDDNISVPLASMTKRKLGEASFTSFIDFGSPSEPLILLARGHLYLHPEDFNTHLNFNMKMLCQ